MLASMNPSGRDTARVVIAALSLCEAIALTAAALVLPWRIDWIVHSVASILVLTFLSVSLGAVLRASWLPRAARICGALSVTAFLALCIRIVLWAAHLSHLYGEVGWTITGGLLVFFFALGFFLIPFPIFLLVHFSRSEWRARVENSVPPLGLALALSFAVSALVSGTADAARGDVFVKDGSARETIARGLHETGNKKSRYKSLWSAAPIRCDIDENEEGIWVLTYAGEKEVESACLHGAPSEKEHNLRKVLAKNRGARIKVDILHRRGTLRAKSTLLSALSLRPGRDGVCSKSKCWLPWQLIGTQKYVAYQPLATVPEARFGVDVEALARDLDAPVQSHLYVISTDSFIVEVKGQNTRVTELLRMGRPPSPLTRQEAHKAHASAAAYILRAQQDDGSFIYTIDPFTMEKNAKSLVLPRHGGTTLALCELTSGSKILKKTVKRATALIERLHRRKGSVGYFAKKAGDRRVYLRDSTLPMVAILQCARAGHLELPSLWTSVAEFLLGQQRKDGSFFPEFDAGKGSPEGDYEIVFGAGQALYALVLMEEHLKNKGSLTETEEQLMTRIGRALDLGMNHYAGTYWDRAPKSFFFLEENWHCIAARAALATHRRDAYERFCLDYVTFKSRFIQTSESQGFRGGMTLSPLFVPHATATSGFGEAAAAALAIAKVRGETHPELEEKLALALGYLTRTQLQPETCFFCKTNRVYGGFTESAISGSIRIDYVQHAMAALGHGQEVLGPGWMRP